MSATQVRQPENTLRYWPKWTRHGRRSRPPATPARYALALALSLAAATSAHADPEPTTETDAAPAERAAGAQALPPSPPAPQPAALVPDPGQRRAIRGCPLDQDCLGHALAGLREFEIEAFAPNAADDSPASNPWIESDDPYGRAAGRAGHLRRPAADHGARAPEPAQAASTGTIDRAWLEKLDLPDLPMVWHERVIRYLEFYRDDPRGRNIMRGWLQRQGRYRDMILTRLRAAGLPEDLLYVAMIESSYDPSTTSRVGAGGLWQFMPAGGRIYGLWSDRWIDERNDPVRSTDAVLMYFADLHQRFGDWPLALAAYNGGYGAVIRAIARYHTNDYWQLIEYENALPWGTSMYVPKIVAAAIVGRNRAAFGFDDIGEAPAMTWDTVELPKSVSLSAVARAAGTSVDTIKELNPQLRRGRTPPTIQGYVIRIPAGSRALFSTRFAQLRGDWDDTDAYVVAHGERFEDVATTHGISRRRLAKLNGIEHESEVRGGTVLVVPRVSAEEREKNRAEADADLYISGAPRAEEGEPLLAAVPDPGQRVPGRTRVFYRVVTGDTVAGIANAFAVPIDALAEWNDLTPEAKLHPRMVLQVFVPEGWDQRAPDGAPVALLDPDKLEIVARGSEKHLDIIEHRMGRERSIYRPEKAESFTEIGKKFGLEARDLARINRKSHRTVVEPGEEVIIYQVVDRSRTDRADDQAREARKAKRKRRQRAKKGASK